MFGFKRDDTKNCIKPNNYDIGEYKQIDNPEDNVEERDDIEMNETKEIDYKNVVMNKITDKISVVLKNNGIKYKLIGNDLLIRDSNSCNLFINVYTNSDEEVNLYIFVNGGQVFEDCLDVPTEQDDNEIEYIANRFSEKILFFFE